MATDILISCFATPSPETLNSIKSGPNSLSDFMPQDGFSNGAPKLINVGYTLAAGEGAVTDAYAREADKYKQIGGGSISTSSSASQRLRASAAQPMLSATSGALP